MSGRGEVRLQPSYFTSSLYVHTFRKDVSQLIDAFWDQYLQIRPTQPFGLFKSIWNSQGWNWIHLRVFDARAREAFLNVSSRLFLERTVPMESPMNRVVALFAFYTFFSTQPDSSAPPLYAIKHVSIPIDNYNSLMMLPSALTTEELRPLQLCASYVLSQFCEAQVFQVLPPSELHPQNPRDLPREIFYKDEQDVSASNNEQAAMSTADGPKKKGRPSRRDKMQRAKDALKSLEKWLENTDSVTPNSSQMASTSTAPSTAISASVTTHVLLAHPPTTTRHLYQSQKSHFLDSLASEPGDGQENLRRANNAIMARLRKIDQMAAERGLEVGSEGGERTGLERVEKAAAELDRSSATGPRGGILGLLEGGGMASAERPLDKVPLLNDNDPRPRT